MRLPYRRQAQVEAVLTQVDQEIAEYLGKLPPEGSVAPAALRAEDALWVGYYVQLAVSLMLFVVAMLLSAGLIATQVVSPFAAVLEYLVPVCGRKPRRCGGAPCATAVWNESPLRVAVPTAIHPICIV